MTRRQRVDGGPGWYIDADTLLPVIEDAELFRESLKDDPAVDVLVALWSGDPVQAASQAAGTPHLAVMQQHLGKSLFVAGRFDEAARAFETALRLREDAGADEHLVNSSRAALERAREAAGSKG